MTRTRLDAVVAAFVAGIVVLGVGTAWQTYRQTRTHGEMMGHTVTHGLHPIWYLLGALLIAGAVAGVYWAVRDRDGTAVDERRTTRASDSAPSTDSDPRSETSGPSRTESVRGSPSRSTKPRVLDVLPEDERRILEPVVDSPGITQIALRDRAAFSKSKVSQTVTDLEKRGLLYREPQGRTYRVYPSDDLGER